jgi:hypothetical protein
VDGLGITSCVQPSGSEYVSRSQVSGKTPNLISTDFFSFMNTDNFSYDLC